MKIKTALLILILELVVVALVITLFMNLDHRMAGVFGGFIFGLLGLVIGFVLLRERNIKSFTFWWLFVYLFYSVLPMIYVRLTQWGIQFSEIQVWGMSGPVFHKVSEKIYFILIVATVLDLIFSLFRRYRPTNA